MLMIRTLILSCLLSVICVQAEDRQCLDKVPIQDWTFSLQNWCKRNEVQIHGLWPNPDCKECYKNPFNVDQLEPDTLDSMGKYWNGCGTSNEELWEHEWGKHGCGSGLTMNDYFKTAVNIYDHYKSSCDFNKGKRECKIYLSNEEVQCFVPSSSSPSDEKSDNNNDDLFSLRDKLGWYIVRLIGLVFFVSLIRSTSLRESRTTNEGLELSLIDSSAIKDKNQSDQESKDNIEP